MLLLIIIYQSPLTITIISWERVNPSQPHPATQRNDAVSASLMNAASVCALSVCGALDDAGGCTGGFELCVFLKETGCGEETWLPRIERGGDFMGMAVKNNICLAVPLVHLSAEVRRDEGSAHGAGVLSPVQHA